MTTTSAHPRDSLGLWSRIWSRWWVPPLVVYAGIRLLMLPVFLIAWTRQGANLGSYSDGPPDFLTFLSRSWDGEWYALIAEHGYPATIPLDPSTGHVDQNAWAFFPLYPMTVRAVMTVTTLPWDVAAPVTSVVLGGIAMLLLNRLITIAAPQAVERAPHLPVLGVAAFTAFPSAATFSVAYSESLAALLIIATLLLLAREHYLLAAIPIMLLGFTRPAALPMAAVAFWLLIRRWRRHRQGVERLNAGSATSLLVLAVLGIAAGLAWPLITAAVTGVPNAYFATQSSWRHAAETGVPFQAWAAKLDSIGHGLGPVIVLAIIALIIIGTFLPITRRLGPELQSWGGAYAGYLVAVANLNSSVVRFALLDVAIQLLTVAWARRPIWALPAIGVLLAGQAVWILQAWVWTPPAGGFTP